MAVLAARIVLAALLTATLLATPAGAADRYTLMAVYLYNFAKFTRWPAASFKTPEASLKLCVLGQNPFGVALDEISHKTVKTRPLNIKYFPRVAVVSDCHILFISRSERQRLAPILADIEGRPILTVSDIEGFTDRGGMIGLRLEDRLLRFVINLEPARLAGLRLSSKLLELASAVMDERR